MRFQLDLTKEYGIVLEGGGARGSYQNSTSESDSMYVLIMSTKLAQGITTHSQVRNVIN